MLRSLRFSVFALGVLALGACGFNTAPVLNVKNAPVVVPHGVVPSAATTRDAIVRGLADKGWTIDSEGESSIVARVTSGGHTATARIDYDATSYSITYVDSSEGLLYDGVEIHRRYNHWINLLRKAIDKELSHTSGGEVPAQAAPADMQLEPPAEPVAAEPPAAEPPPVAPADDEPPPPPPPN